jgi:hypothetical protein
MREFIGRQEMMFMTTVDATDASDCTFRAGPPGFVQVIERDRIAWPEYRGFFESGYVGLLFADFFRDKAGLQVNGWANIEDRGTGCWVVVHVVEAYFHGSRRVRRPVLLRHGGGRTTTRHVFTVARD